MSIECALDLRKIIAQEICVEDTLKIIRKDNSIFSFKNGSVDQIITTDGDGNLSWSDNAGGGGGGGTGIISAQRQNIYYGLDEYGAPIAGDTVEIDGNNGDPIVGLSSTLIDTTAANYLEITNSGILMINVNSLIESDTDQSAIRFGLKLVIIKNPNSANTTLYQREILDEGEESSYASNFHNLTLQHNESVTAGDEIAYKIILTNYGTGKIIINDVASSTYEQEFVEIKSVVLGVNQNANGGANSLAELSDVSITNNILYLGAQAITDIYANVNGTANIHMGDIEMSGSIILGGDASGDMYYRNSAGELTRIAVGADNHILTLNGAVPGWEAAAGGGGGASALNDLTDVLIETNSNSMYIGNDPSSTMSTAQYNLAIGATALSSITEGDNNVAVGYDSMTTCTTGASNTCLGIRSGYSVNTGTENVLLGEKAGHSITSTSNNVCIGYNASIALTGSHNITIGNTAAASSVDGDGIIVIGSGAGTAGTGDNNSIVMGRNATGNGTETITLGNASITAVYCAQDSSATLYCGGLNIGSTLVTSTAAELNILDGVTSTAAELNILDGVTSTAAELNLIDGSSAGTIVNSKALIYGSSGEVNATTLQIGGTALALKDLDDVLIEDYSLYIGNDPSSTTGTAEYNVAIGATALSSITTGDNNVAIGYDSMTTCTIGSDNVAIGKNSLLNTTEGVNNTAIGVYSLQQLTTGVQNVAIGHNSLETLTTAGTNTAVGFMSGSSQDATGSIGNVSIGQYAGAKSHQNDTCIGINAGRYVNGSSNVAIGTNAGQGDSISGATTSYHNVSIGYDSMKLMETGCEQNVSVGSLSLNILTTGDNNVCLGYQSGNVLTTGSNNVIIGHDADPSANNASNQIVIGKDATGQANNSVTLGNADVTAVYCAQDSGATLFCGGLNIAGTALALNNLSDVLIEDNSLYIGHDPSITTSTAEYNIALGITALDAITTGDKNVAIGYDALTACDTGSNNVAIGYNTLTASTTAAGCIAIGNNALSSIAAQDQYTMAIGFDSAKYITLMQNYGTLIAIGNHACGGNYNNLNATHRDSIFIGAAAGYQNWGQYCVAIGHNAMYGPNSINDVSNSTVASHSTAIGYSSLLNITSGDGNTALGNLSGCTITTGANNVCIGYNSGGKLSSGQNNDPPIYNKIEGITTGSNNVCIGQNTMTSAVDSVNQIVIGNDATGTGDNEIALGNTSITAIKAQVNSITAYSDERIKQDIQDSDLGLEFINNLRPVKYKKINPADYPEPLLEDRFKNNSVERPNDDDNTYDGLIAQEVKQTLDNLGLEWNGHSIDENTGKQGLQYGGLVVPLINAVKELNRENDELKTQMSNIISRLDALEN